MKFIELAYKRYSVRKYAQKPIPREEILKCVEAARIAPSACNSQPWKFIIVDNAEKIKNIADKACHTIYSFNKFIGQSGALVIVSSGRENFLRAAAGKIKGTNYSLIDIGISCEHLVLQAEEIGIGSCWIGWFDERPVKRILNLPSRDKIDIIIALGYPGENGEKEKKRKELKDIVRFVD